MRNYRAIVIIGIIEILIGSITIFSNFLFLALGINYKTPTVLGFVVITGMASTLVGVGILKRKKLAYQILLYFSSVIIFTKCLMFLDIIRLNGTLEISMHRVFNVPLTEALKNLMINLKNSISIIYHGIVMYYLLNKNIKQVFHP